MWISLSVSCHLMLIHLRQKAKPHGNSLEEGCVHTYDKVKVLSNPLMPASPRGTLPSALAAAS